MHVYFDQLNLIIYFCTDIAYNGLFFYSNKLNQCSNLSSKAEHQTEEELNEGGASGCSNALSGEKTDPGTINLGRLEVVVSVPVVTERLLTLISDAPCKGEVQRGYEGKASQCVSVAESTTPYLGDDLKGKKEENLFHFMSH